MQNRSSVRLISVLMASLVFGFVSCRYQPDYDALSAFPSNRQKLSIREIELIPVDREQQKRVARQRQVADPVENQQQQAVVQKGVVGYPYDRKSGSGSGKFVRLNPISTGFKVISSPELESKDAELIRSPFTASGIAIGDVDGDGASDIYVASRTGGGRLFKNMGDFNFRDVTSTMAIELKTMWGTSPTMVDVNDDGLLDIYLCCYNSPNRLFINRGRKFREQSERFGLDFSGASTQAAFADYDGDGDLDLYLVTNRLIPRNPDKKIPVDRVPGERPRIPEEFREQNRLIQHRDGSYRGIASGQFDRLYRNEGYRFVDVTEESGIGKHAFHGMAAVWWDFNNDNWPDIYVANDKKDPDQLFRNNGPDAEGHVTFTEVGMDSLSHVPMFSKGVDFGDLNNDGFAELAGTGTAGVGHFGSRMSTGNLYGSDGDAWFLNWGSPPQQLANVLLLNSGVRRLVDIAQLAGTATTDWTWSVRFADLDNDGLQDLIYSTGRVRDFLNNDLNQQATGNDDAKYAFWLDQPIVKTADRVFRNLGDLKFEDRTVEWGLDEEHVSQCLVTADLDNDGDLDLVCSGFGEEVRLYRNDLKSQKSIRVRLAGIQTNSYGLGVRVRLQVDENGPEQVRLVNPSRGFMACDEPIIQFGVGDASRVHRLVIDWPTGFSQKMYQLKSDYLYRIEEPENVGFVGRKAPQPPNTRLVEFSVDRSKFDLVRTEELEFDDFQQQPLLPFKLSQAGPAISWGDIDRDGDYDLFRSGPAFDESAIFINDGRSEFENSRQTCFGQDRRSEDLGAVFFDADGDEDLDLYVVSGGVESDENDASMQDRLYLNDGVGNFEKSEGLLPELKFSGCSVSAADYDRDGRIDLFVGGKVRPGNYPESPGSVLLRNTDSGFEDVTVVSAPELVNSGMVVSSAWIDVDNDDWLDLVFCTQWGPIRVFRNQEGRLVDQTAAAGTADHKGLFNSLCPGDIDNDGDIDFVVGNLGLNTDYQADADHPIYIYHDRFGDSETSRIVEAVDEGGVIYPRRGLELLQQYLPELGNQFSSVSSFSSAPLDQLFSPQVMETAARLEINCLESGILVNQTGVDGIHFEFRPLPRAAQTSPIYGAQLADVNGDGHLDLVALQNDSAVFPETVPFDNGIGLLLWGKGKAEFEPVSPLDSGLVIQADGTALTSIDLNSDDCVDFVAATRNDGIQYLASRSRGNACAIDIGKLSGNRVYIGTIVDLQLSDGSQQRHQITSNSGYLGQSPPIIYTDSQSVTGARIRWPDGTTKEGDIRSLSGN